MNVLYDMTSFGYAHRFPRARTGIYRVVERIASGVQKTASVNLLGYASQGNDADTLEYLKLHPSLATCSEQYVSGLSTCNDLIQQSHGLKGAIQKIRFLLKKQQQTQISIPPVDLCHATFFHAPEVILSRLKLPIVQTVYDLIPLLFPQYFEWGEERALKTVIEKLTGDSFVTCISESTRNDLCNYDKRIDPAKVFVTPLAAAEVFQPSTDPAEHNVVKLRFSLPEGSRYFLTACTLEPRKNIELAVKSFVKLALEQNVPNLYLVLAGPVGWKNENVFAAIDNVASVKERIIVTGFVSDHELAVLYSGAIAFIYPSRYEGFGLPPLEAMQCGTPVITSNTSSLPEVVGDAGIMIDPDDGDALCQAMMNFYSDQGFRDGFAARALARAQLFSWKRCVDETIAVYRLAVANC